MKNWRLLPLNEGVAMNGVLEYDVVTAPPAHVLQSDQALVVFWMESNTVAVEGIAGSRDDVAVPVEPVPVEPVPVVPVVPVEPVVVPVDEPVPVAVPVPEPVLLPEPDDVPVPAVPVPPEVEFEVVPVEMFADGADDDVTKEELPPQAMNDDTVTHASTSRQSLCMFLRWAQEESRWSTG